MSQSLEDYRTALLERALQIRDANQPQAWYLPQTVRFAKEATHFLHLLLKSAIAAGVTIPPQDHVLPQNSLSIEELRQHCCLAVEQLQQKDLGLAQQIHLTLELVGQIARLVRLESEQARPSTTHAGFSPHSFR